MLICEEVRLLLMDEAGNGLANAPQRGLASGYLADLALHERVDLIPGEPPLFRVFSSTPVLQPALDAALQTITPLDGSRLDRVILAGQATANQALTDQLVAAGLLHPVAGADPAQALLPDVQARASVAQRLGAVLHHTRPPTSAERHLLTILVMLRIHKSSLASVTGDLTADEVDQRIRALPHLSSQVALSQALASIALETRRKDSLHFLQSPLPYGG